MRRIFLGVPVHWALIISLVIIGWLLGNQRLHVIWFNLFTVSLLIATVIVVLIVLATSRPGAQLTRDPLEPDGE